MTHRAVGNNRVLRQDQTGTFYKDIVFVSSGALSMNNPATSDSTSSTTRKDDANEIREFYKNVLAMPKTEAKSVRRRKAPVIRQVSGKTSSGTLASGLAPHSEAVNDSSTTGPAATLQQMESSAAPSTQSTEPSPPQSTTTSSSTLSSQPGSSTVTESKSTLAEVTSTPKNSQVTSDEIVRRNWSHKSQAAATGTTITSTPPPKQVIAEGYVFCEPCQMEVRKDDLDRHRRGTAHLMSQELPIKPIDALTLGHENKGFRMLVSSGWDYDKGLGAEGQGVRHPVATRLKHDRLALGAAGTSKKLVTHTFEEIEQSRTKPTAKSNRRVPLSADDYRKQAEKERRDRVRMMIYMKK
ncbi:G patch domain and ankyrin repeat-containing protein 1 [Mortierella sp. 14UC]|nr:G patch domain and ankyrin repeat-containing protein 1 [Mortierella sp. 14UC]